MNTSIYDILDFTISDLSEHQIRSLELKMYSTNPKLPSYIAENIAYHLRYNHQNHDNDTGAVTTTRGKEVLTPESLLRYLKEVYPNIRINYLVSISRIHLCHDFANYLQYIMTELINDDDY